MENMDYQVRPGACPLQAAKSQLLDCLSLTFCVKDNDCSKPNEKCCWLSCGRVCMAVADAPAVEEPFVVSTEAQTEPRVTETPSIRPLQRKTEKPKDPPPTAVKPGQCRQSSYICPIKTITRECKSDSNCSGTMKCCPSGCSQKCAPPDTGIMSKNPSNYKAHKQPAELTD
ncbi:WAP four-disulfide core domain protein 2-like isoform X1 [Rhineura floridana]|uniref:WAP four-disulfide core domain protein 2-like isoform X1 n=1 Tax=Rhineura floridana TaxID=261503 RepID=UPI002AC8564A|nr:WAP four-disulfide core domain protein 2-like isoform X1 [Rhineura floridana]